MLQDEVLSSLILLYGGGSGDEVELAGGGVGEGSFVVRADAAAALVRSELGLGGVLLGVAGVLEARGVGLETLASGRGGCAGVEGL